MPLKIMRLYAAALGLFIMALCQLGGCGACAVRLGRGQVVSVQQEHNWISAAEYGAELRRLVTPDNCDRSLKRLTPLGPRMRRVLA